MVSVAVGMVLGVAVMFLPIVMYTHLSVTTDTRRLTGGENETFDLKPGVSASEAAEAAEAAKMAPLEKLDEAAQVLGRADAGPLPFPSSLVHVILVLATGLIAALGLSLYFKKKMGPVRNLNPQTNR